MAAIGASPGGRGTPKFKKARVGGGKGKGHDDDDDLTGVADSPGSMMSEGIDDDDDDGYGEVGRGGWDYWWWMEREELMDGMEMRVQGMLEEVLGTKVQELSKQVAELKKELKEAKQVIAKLDGGVREGSEGGGGVGRADPWSVWQGVGISGKGKGRGAATMPTDVWDPSQIRDDRRKREMIVRGFERNTPKKEVLQKIDKFLVENGIDIEGKAFTVGPMVSFGIVRFESVEDKVGFKNWLALNPEKVTGPTMWFGDNLEKERRLMEVATGKVKKALCLVREGRDDITIGWRRGEVFVGRNLVAKWEVNKMVLLRGEVVDMVDRIKGFIGEVGVGEVEVVVRREK